MVRRKKVGAITRQLLNDAIEFCSTLHFFFKKDPRLGPASLSLRRFSQSKFHFDFEDDSRQGLRHFVPDPVLRLK